jgi:hypothetical protein
VENKTYHSIRTVQKQKLKIVEADARSIFLNIHAQPFVILASYMDLKKNT